LVDIDLLQQTLLPIVLVHCPNIHTLQTVPLLQALQPVVQISLCKRCKHGLLVDIDLLQQTLLPIVLAHCPNMYPLQTILLLQLLHLNRTRT